MMILRTIAGERRRSVAFCQRVPETLDAGRGQLGQFLVAKVREDVKNEMLSVLLDGALFQPVIHRLVEPAPPGLGNGDADAARNVNALSDFDRHLGPPLLGRLLGLKGFDVLLAVVQIGNDPRRFLPFRGVPHPLAHRGHLKPRSLMIDCWEPSSVLPHSLWLESVPSPQLGAGSLYAARR
jgi:hypothetical protein